jgi:hypothetical protein
VIISDHPQAPGVRAGPPVDERRGAFRYQLQFALRYKARWRDCTLRIGYGRTRDISRKAIRFTSDIPLPVGSSVELFMDWPIAQRERPLLLRASGYISRSYATDVVVLLSRHSLEMRHVQPR